MIYVVELRLFTSSGLDNMPVLSGAILFLWSRSLKTQCHVEVH